MSNSTRRIRRGNIAPASTSRKSRAAAIARADRHAYSVAERAAVLSSATTTDSDVLA